MYSLEYRRKTQALFILAIKVLSLQCQESFSNRNYSLMCATRNANRNKDIWILYCTRTMNYTISTSSKTRIKMLVSLMIVALTAVVIGTVQLRHIPNYDELYHLLSAMSWNSSGTLAILDGEYTRASFFTLIVAQFIDWFG